MDNLGSMSLISLTFHTLSSNIHFMKRTWQPKKLKRLRKHGFLHRTETSGGLNILKRRRAKGRAVMAPSRITKGNVS